MTENEEAIADALDEEYTKNPPTPGPNGTGAWTKWRRNVAHINDGLVGRRHELTELSVEEPTKEYTYKPTK